MGRNLCPDLPRLTIAAAAAAFLLFIPGALFQIGVIFCGAFVGWVLYRNEMQTLPIAGRADWKHHLVSGAVLVIFFVLLIFLPAIASVSGNKNIAIFDSFYRAGSLVFGGGHVVLPLLHSEVVPGGLVSDDAFLAGHGLAQAVPGPLFTFEAYLGTVIYRGSTAWLGGLLCLVAIFLPGLLLISGVLPFWSRLRSKTWAQAALRGANAAVVGVLLAALYNPVWLTSVGSARDAALALIAFGLLQ